VIAAARRHDKIVIVSHHDFDSTPTLDRLETIADDARALGADIAKISTMANSKQDLRILASLAIKQADLGVIVIAMGAIGTIGRVLFPALGSRLTFSHMGEGSAPGQLDFFETFDLMRKFYPDFHEQKSG
jgi:3-dehydroquinate dehydratase-1